jgi:hypothetical protein
VVFSTNSLISRSVSFSLTSSSSVCREFLLSYLLYSSFSWVLKFIVFFFSSQTLSFLSHAVSRHSLCREIRWSFLVLLSWLRALIVADILVDINRFLNHGSFDDRLSWVMLQVFSKSIAKLFDLVPFSKFGCSNGVVIWQFPQFLFYSIIFFYMFIYLICIREFKTVANMCATVTVRICKKTIVRLRGGSLVFYFIFFKQMIKKKYHVSRVKTKRWNR